MIVSMVITGFALGYLMSDSIDRKFSKEPPKNISTTAQVLRQTLRGLSMAQVQQYIKRMSPELESVRVEPVHEVLLPLGCRTPGRDWCWVRHPAATLFGGRKVEVFIELPNEGPVLVIGPFEAPSPLDLRSLLTLLAIILSIALVTGVALAIPMVRRLRRMERAAAEIEQGNLDARADVTGQEDEINSMARQFNHMASRLQELIEGNVHLVHAVSHELRTPIARVRFSLEMLASAESTEERERRVKRIEADLEALDGLIEELLLLIRYEDGNTSIPQDNFEPEAPTRRGAARLSAMAGDKEVDIRIDIDGSLLYGSERSFERVVTNLVSNGLRYADSRVELSLRRDGDELVLDVADDGPGIPPEAREQVFEPFARLDRSRSRDSGGVGLGLTIVSRIMNTHNGSVEILDSHLGGAILRTRWPCRG